MTQSPSSESDATRDRPDAAVGAPTGPLAPFRSVEPDPSDASPAVRLMLETLHKLVGRIEEIEERLPDAVAVAEDRLSALSADVDGLKTVMGESAGQFGRAIARLSERLSRIEARIDAGSGHAPPSVGTSSGAGGTALSIQERDGRGS